MHLESLRVILALAAIRDLDVIQFDITSAHLHGALKEAVYMEQPEDYVAPGKEDRVWRLKKGLYGLVQAGRMWNEELTTRVESQGFTATLKDPAKYIENSWTDCDFTAAAGFWVDDCIAIGSRKELSALAESIDAQYIITGLGEVRWVLSMSLEHDHPACTISRSKKAFIESIIARFNLTDTTPVTTSLTPGTHLSAVDCPILKEKMEEMANQLYRELVVALAWLVLRTRPDVAFATGSLARFGHNLGRVYWDAAKRVLHYLNGTKQWRLVLGGKSPEIAALTDADWEIITTTDAQSENIPSAEEVDDTVTLRDDKGVRGRLVVDVEGFCCEGRGLAVANIGGVGN